MVNKKLTITGSTVLVGYT